MTSYAPDPWISPKPPRRGGGDPRVQPPGVVGGGGGYRPGGPPGTGGGHPREFVRPMPGYRPGAPVGTGGGHPREPVRPPYTPSWGNDAYGPPTRYGSGGGMQQAAPRDGRGGYADYEPQMAVEGPGFLPPIQQRPQMSMPPRGPMVRMRTY